MTIAFSTQWPKHMPEHMAGKPTYFVDKIWQSLLRDDIKMNALEFTEKLKEVLPLIGESKVGDYPQKKHTIREDKKNLWKAGNDIHFVINNRTKNRFQFAPVVKCVSTQKINLFWSNTDFCDVFIDNKKIGTYNPRDEEHYKLDNLKQLAINDGFDSVEDFFAWFNTDFTGKIIHWTNLKY